MLWIFKSGTFKSSKTGAAFSVSLESEVLSRFCSSPHNRMLRSPRWSDLSKSSRLISPRTKTTWAAEFPHTRPDSLVHMLTSAMMDGARWRHRTTRGPCRPRLRNDPSLPHANWGWWWDDHFDPGLGIWRNKSAWIDNELLLQLSTRNFTMEIPLPRHHASFLCNEIQPRMIEIL